MYMWKVLFLGLMCDAVKLRSCNPVRLKPIGENQVKYCGLLEDKGVAILAGVGPAGCGKTAFACHAAVKALSTGEVERIVLTRPLVAVDEELGFLPGSMEQKMDPWIRPMMDVLGDFYTKSEIRRLMDEGVIEIAPLAYMRGRTFRRSFIIADEMQNSTPNQMLMILTRIGEESRLVITGDLMQSDLKGRVVNGLEDFYDRWKLETSSGGSLPMIRCVEFDKSDVQRSAVVASVLEMYSFRGKSSGVNDCAIFPKGL